MHEEQRQRAVHLMQARWLNAALFASPASITWLTGFAPPIQTGPNPFAAAPPLLWWDGERFTMAIVDGLAASTGPLFTYRGLTNVFRTCGRDDQQVVSGEFHGKPFFRQPMDHRARQDLQVVKRRILRRCLPVSDAP